MESYPASRSLTRSLLYDSVGHPLCLDKLIFGRCTRPDCTLSHADAGGAAASAVAGLLATAFAPPSLSRAPPAVAPLQSGSGFLLPSDAELPTRAPHPPAVEALMPQRELDQQHQAIAEYDLRQQASIQLDESAPLAVATPDQELTSLAKLLEHNPVLRPFRKSKASPAMILAARGMPPPTPYQLRHSTLSGFAQLTATERHSLRGPPKRHKAADIAPAPVAAPRPVAFPFPPPTQPRANTGLVPTRSVSFAPDAGDNVPRTTAYATPVPSWGPVQVRNLLNGAAKPFTPGVQWQTLDH